MLDPAKTREREELLHRIRELDRVIAEGQRRMWEFKKSQAARLIRSRRPAARHNAAYLPRS
jgi:hypothetical protein